MKWFLLSATMIVLAGGKLAAAAEPVTLTLEDHRFSPNEVTVPANQRFSIVVMNQDDTPAEFESHDLKLEKIIVPKGKITVSAGPLKPGIYKFFDDYHDDTASGTLTAKE